MRRRAHSAWCDHLGCVSFCKLNTQCWCDGPARCILKIAGVLEGRSGPNRDGASARILCVDSPVKRRALPAATRRALHAAAAASITSSTPTGSAFPERLRKLDSMFTQEAQPCLHSAPALLRCGSGRPPFIMRNLTSGWTSQRRPSPVCWSTSRIFGARASDCCHLRAPFVASPRAKRPARNDRS